MRGWASDTRGSPAPCVHGSLPEARCIWNSSGLNSLSMAFSLFHCYSIAHLLPRFHCFPHCIEHSETWSQVLLSWTIPKHFCLSPSWIGPHGCSSPQGGSSGKFGVCSKSCYAPLRPDKPWPFDWLLLERLCAALSAIAKQPLKHAIVRWTRMRLRCSSMNTLRSKWRAMSPRCCWWNVDVDTQESLRLQTSEVRIGRGPKYLHKHLGVIYN